MRQWIGLAGAALGAVALSGCGARLSGFIPGATLMPAAAEAPRPVRLLAVGDLMLGSSVKDLIAEHGPNYPFRNSRRLLTEADLAFANLETPLSERGTPTPGKSAETLAKKTNYIFRAPTSAAEGVAWAGFDVVSIANNHTMDYGPDALADTIQALTDARVRSIGGGANIGEASAPVYLERNGQRFAFFGVSDVLPLYSAADRTHAGIAPARGARFYKWMPHAIRAAHKRADWVIVSVHWGKEKYTRATAKQTALGHKLIDWGADVVIGHHTHVLGPVEHYRGGLIHYSLGNFVGNPGSRSDVGAWSVTFTPGGRPEEERLALRWDGKRLATM